MTNSRQKGARGERECRDLLKEHGFEARRGQQFSGLGESPDVVHNIPGLHIEVKRTEALSIYKAMAQAIADAKGNTPTVFHKRNNKEWLVVLHAHDFLELIKELHRGKKLV